MPRKPVRPGADGPPILSKGTRIRLKASNSRKTSLLAPADGRCPRGVRILVRKSRFAPGTGPESAFPAAFEEVAASGIGSNPAQRRSPRVAVEAEHGEAVESRRARMAPRL